MSVNRRWIRRVIEAARAEAGPMPWTRARTVRRHVSDRTDMIRTTLRQKSR